MGDVEPGDMALEKSLVLADLGADIGGGPVAGQGVGVVEGMVKDVPTRRPQGLQGGPGHPIGVAGSGLVGPGADDRRGGPPLVAVDVQVGVHDGFAVDILGLPVVVEGERISPVVVVVEGSLRGRAGSTCGPIDGGDDDGRTGSGEEGRAGGGAISGRNSRPVGGDSHGGTSADVDHQCDLAVVHERGNGRVVHIDAILLVGGGCAGCANQEQAGSEEGVFEFEGNSVFHSGLSFKRPGGSAWDFKGSMGWGIQNQPAPRKGRTTAFGLVSGLPRWAGNGVRGSRPRPPRGF